MDSEALPQRPPRRAGPTVRTTILVTVLLLTAIALATAGYTAAKLQDARVTTRIDSDLTASYEEFMILAETGIDPDSGEPFASSSQLIRTAISRIIPARNEGVVGIIDGRIEYLSSGAPVALEQDPELVAQLGPLLHGTTVELATIATSTTTYRIAAIPVSTGVEAPTSDPSDGAVSGLVLGYDLSAELGEFRQVFVTYTLVAAASLVVVGVVGWLVAGRLLHPIRVLAETARRIGREDLSERIEVAGNDDLAHMTLAVNEMLGRLDDAFEAQRELVGDVSHELRTPLTVVRGHLEVMDADDPDDTRAVKTLVLDEVTRMNRVVDDLTTLASIDQPGFVRPLDMEVGSLTDEVFDKAIALGEREWAMEGRAEAHLLGDSQRLTQAWLQLASNAVKFSTPGSRIVLGSVVELGTVTLFVRDHGVGIEQADLSRIFERFERAGDRSTRGSGLGLAIVRAIAEAHGGFVTVSSTYGVGSTFAIHIPGVTPHHEEYP